MSKRTKLLTQAGSVIALCFMAIGFQNCGKKMQFSSLSAFENSLKDSTIEEIPVDDVIDEPVADPGIIDDNTDEVIDVVVDPIKGNDGGNSGNDDDRNDHGTDVGGNDADDSDDGDVVSSGPQDYICIVAGSGKSQKLALVNNTLVAQTSAVKTVCTTQRGCLEIAAQKFEVKSAEYRGYCKNGGADSVSLSEEQLESVLNN